MLFRGDVRDVQKEKGGFRFAESAFFNLAEPVQLAVGFGRIWKWTTLLC